jgi:hypothetical protein
MHGTINLKYHQWLLNLCSSVPQFESETGTQECYLCFSRFVQQVFRDCWIIPWSLLFTPFQTHYYYCSIIRCCIIYWQLQWRYIWMKEGMSKQINKFWVRSLEVKFTHEFTFMFIYAPKQIQQDLSISVPREWVTEFCENLQYKTGIWKVNNESVMQ